MTVKKKSDSRILKQSNPWSAASCSSAQLVMSVLAVEMLLPSADLKVYFEDLVSYSSYFTQRIYSKSLIQSVVGATSLATGCTEEDQSAASTTNQSVTHSHTLQDVIW